MCSCVFVSEVLQSWRVQLDSPVSTVLLFPLSCQMEASQTTGEKSMTLVRHIFTSQGSSDYSCLFSTLLLRNMQPPLFFRWSKNQPLWCDDCCFFSFWGVELAGYNLLVTSTIEMAVVYRSASRKPLIVLWCWERGIRLRSERLCVFSETSKSVACLVPRTSQRATSGTRCFAPWSLTWILTGRRRCCWEPTDRSEPICTSELKSSVRSNNIWAWHMLNVVKHGRIKHSWGHFPSNWQEWTRP